MGFEGGGRVANTAVRGLAFFPFAYKGFFIFMGIVFMELKLNQDTGKLIQPYKSGLIVFMDFDCYSFILLCDNPT